MADLIEMLKDCGALKFGEFVLTSGRKSSFYVDIKRASTRPDILKRIAERMAEGMTEDNVAGAADLGPGDHPLVR